MTIWRKYDDPLGGIRYGIKAKCEERAGKYIVLSVYDKEDSIFDDRDSALVRCALLDYGYRYVFYLDEYLGKSEDEILLYYPQFHDLIPGIILKYRQKEIL
jgi:hypothetical protein